MTPVGNEVNAKYRVPMHPGNSGQLKNKFPGLEKEEKRKYPGRVLEILKKYIRK